MIYNTYCINCGAEYTFQASGSWSLNYPEKFNDEDYCPECKEAILRALNSISQKTEIKWIPTDLVDFETLKRWEKEEEEEYQKECNKKMSEGNIVFPRCKRVFAGLFRMSKPGQPGDSTTAIHIRGRENHTDKFFHCQYWRNSGEVEYIHVKVRVKVKPQGFARNTDPKLSMGTGEYQIVCYELD